MNVTFMRRATAPVTMSGTAEEEDEGEEEEGGPAAGRRALRRQEIYLSRRPLRRGRGRRAAYYMYKLYGCRDPGTQGNISFILQS